MIGVLITLNSRVIGTSPQISKQMVFEAESALVRSVPIVKIPLSVGEQAAYSSATQLNSYDVQAHEMR